MICVEFCVDVCVTSEVETLISGPWSLPPTVLWTTITAEKLTISLVQDEISIRSAMYQEFAPGKEVAKETDDVP